MELHELPPSSARVDPAVVLEVEALGITRVPGHLVHALAELGLGVVGQEARDDAPVAGLPGRAAVVAAVHAGGRDGDQEARRVARVEEHRVEAEAAAARLPPRPVGVVPQPLHEGEGAAAVVAAEQGRRFDAGVEDVRLVDRARCQLPDAGQGSVAAGREGERRPLVLGPGGSEVVGAAQHGTPVVADRADEQPGARPTGVDAGRVHLFAGERRSGHFEVAASAGRGEREEPLGGPDEHQRVQGLLAVVGHGRQCGCGHAGGDEPGGTNSSRRAVATGALGRSGHGLLAGALRIVAFEEMGPARRVATQVLLGIHASRLRRDAVDPPIGRRADRTRTAGRSSRRQGLRRAQRGAEGRAFELVEQVVELEVGPLALHQRQVGGGA